MNLSELIGFFPKQLEATRTADTHKYTLYGGSRGPGKSYWLRWYGILRLLRWAAQGHIGVRVMLASENYPALHERHATKIEIEFPHWLGEFNRSRMEYKLFPEYGSGVLALRNLDDPSKYQSSEFAGMLIDEIGKNPYRTFSLLRGSLRWAGIADTFLAGASNPTPNWIRDIWISRDFEDYPELTAVADQFAYVKALPDDNPILDEGYWRMLDTLPVALRKAWRDGDWFVAMEGIVYPEFTDENRQDYIPDPDKTVEIAFDDGYIDPRAILFIQRTGNHIYVFDELYHSKRLAEESITALIDRMGHWFGWQDAQKTIPHVMPDIAIGSHEAIEFHQQMVRANIPSRHKLHKVVEGVKHLRGLFQDGQGHRAIIVSPRCKNLINELTTGYRYHDDGRKRSDEEKPQDGNDHACDALRYWCWARVRR